LLAKRGDLAFPGGDDLINIKDGLQDVASQNAAGLATETEYPALLEPGVNDVGYRFDVALANDGDDRLRAGLGHFYSKSFHRVSPPPARAGVF
jgi:hypothetical protein